MSSTAIWLAIRRLATRERLAAVYDYLQRQHLTPEKLLGVVLSVVAFGSILLLQLLGYIDLALLDPRDWLPFQWVVLIGMTAGFGFLFWQNDRHIREVNAALAQTYTEIDSLGDEVDALEAKLGEMTLRLTSVRMDLDEGRSVPGGVLEAEETATEGDDEVFCADCHAGVESNEHHEKCVAVTEETPAIPIDWSYTEGVGFHAPEPAYRVDYFSRLREAADQRENTGPETSPTIVTHPAVRIPVPPLPVALKEDPDPVIVERAFGGTTFRFKQEEAS